MLRSGLAKTIPISLLCLGVVKAFAGGCTIKESAPDTVGATIPFEAVCDEAGQTYKWDFGDGSMDSTTGSVIKHTFKALGQYIILVRVTNNDGSFSAIVAGQNILYPATPVKPTQAATLLLDERHSRLWTINPDNNTVVYINYPGFTRSIEFAVGKKPRSIAQDANGNIWVCNQGSGSLSILNSESGKLIQTLELPRASRPFGLAMDITKNLAYVTLQATGRLVKIDASQRKVIASIEVTPGARGLAINQDGTRILVTRFISAKDQGEIVEVDGVTFAVSKRIPIPYDNSVDTDLSGAGVPNALNSVVITPDGREAWFTAKKDNVRRGLFNNGIPFNEENTVRTFFGKLDMQSLTEDVSKRADLDNRNMANAIAFNSNGLYAFVATLGSNTIDIYNTAGYSRTGSIDPQKLKQELAPAGLLVHPNDSMLFVQYFTSREIGVYDISSIGALNDFKLKALIKTIDKDSLGDSAAFGQQVFYNSSDPRMTRSFYISCVTCHMDGMSDERVWDFTERGEGLRNTTTLLGKSGTGSGPLHWSANFDEIQDFEHDIRGPQVGYGFMSNEQFLQGSHNKTLGDKKAGLSPELDALAAYVSSLTAVPASPYRNPDGSLTSQAITGQTIFARPEVGCAKCHQGKGFTDSELQPSLDLKQFEPFHAVVVQPGGFILHDVGTLKPSSGKRLNDTLPGLDTPPLKGLWATAPYLHDGSAASLMDVIDFLNPKDKHGHTSQLSLAEKQNLVAYLEQIDESDSQGSGIPLIRKKKFPASFSILTVRRGQISFLNTGVRPAQFTIMNPVGKIIYQNSNREDWIKVSQEWVLKGNKQSDFGVQR
jgi:DNA-binding beta-propeller fold protein YncE/cytochrome c peroxidase